MSRFPAPYIAILVMCMASAAAGLLADVGGLMDAVDSSLSLVDANHLSHQVEHDLIHGVRRLTSATIHTEPLPQDATPAHDLVAHHH